MKVLVLLVTLFFYSYAVKPTSYQYSGVKVVHTYSDGKTKDYKIKRETDYDCIEIGLLPQNFTQKYIDENIPNYCKKTFITTKGTVQPLFINDKIKTYAEIEVLDFLYNKASKEPNKYVLVDTRKQAWFDQGTIPSSVNVPFEDLEYDEDFIEEYKKAYEYLGLKVLGKDKFDFTNAKTAVFFCNGSWCPLSKKTIKYLVSVGYPEEKLIWYRGGVASWEAVSLTITKKLK